MKRKILTIGTAMLFVAGTVFITSCGNAETQQNENHEHTDGHAHDHSVNTEKPHENHAEMGGGENRKPITNY